MLKQCPDEKHPEHRVRVEDCNCAIHPGGPLIINTIQDVLGIEPVGDGHGHGKIDMDHPTAETWYACCLMRLLLLTWFFSISLSFVFYSTLFFISPSSPLLLSYLSFSRPFYFSQGHPS